MANVIAFSECSLLIGVVGVNGIIQLRWHLQPSTSSSMVRERERETGGHYVSEGTKKNRKRIKFTSF